jgi:hypothetical protein|tara:strand:+ start:3426 stop:3806 length:381 start_codon:yes stop_codon:yes gene_type:complete
MQNTDFSILLEKIPSTNSNTDIAMVSGYNSIVQKISHLFNTNKGELTSDKNFGSDYYVYMFDPVSNKEVLENTMSHYIQASIQGVTDVTVELFSYTQTLLQFKVKFGYFDGIKLQGNIYCNIEVNI